MYRRAATSPVVRSWLWHRPLRVATLAYGAGTVAAAASIGLFAVLDEQSGAPVVVGVERLLWMLAVGLGEAIFWGALMRLALSLQWVFGAALFIVVCGVTGFPKLFLFSLGAMEGMRPSLSPQLGYMVAVLADVAVLVSFLPVARLAQRVAVGDTEDGPLDVSAAACAWAGCVGILGLVVAPLLDLRLVCALVSFAAALGLLRVHRLARDASDDEGAVARARSLIARGLQHGAVTVMLGGVIVVPLRLLEQQRTLDPAVRAVYNAQRMMDHCWVRHVPGGRDGISLLSGDCGGGAGPMFGWDERRKVVLQGEELFQRLPELYPASTASPR